MKERFKEIKPYIIIVLVIVVIRSFFYTPIRVNGESMEPTLFDREIMVLDKISPVISSLKRFDIIVLKDKNSFLIKRIIGLPGEKIKYINNQLYINDKKVKDPYINDFVVELEELKIPQNNYFVLGDNRGHSRDSRVIGFIEKTKIMGKTNLIIFPFNKIGQAK